MTATLMPSFPTPHLDKIEAALTNEKLPPDDAEALRKLKQVYKEWIKKLDAVTGPPEKRIEKLAVLYNEYRYYLDVDLLFDCPRDFLYRQKGQLKLDNSVLEEFLPRLITPEIIPELAGMDVKVGPTRSFAAAFFASSIENIPAAGGFDIRTKAQDFAISKPLYIKASLSSNFADAVQRQASLAYIAVECKTNLDKTMFQEAVATARDVKAAITGARYFVICEWLDMTPLSTAATDIEEVLILRGKRLASNIRKNFDSFARRSKVRDTHTEFLTKYPARASVFARFAKRVRALLRNEVPDERDVLERGYF